MHPKITVMSQSHLEACLTTGTPRCPVVEFRCGKNPHLLKLEIACRNEVAGLKDCTLEELSESQMSC